jgi:hypothetical protein
VDEAGSSCVQKRLKERVIMVGTLSCTLKPGSQRPTNTDVAVGRGPRHQHKRPCLMSADGREIVGPIYTVVQNYGEILSMT